jgi:hypothetical protein
VSCWTSLKEASGGAVKESRTGLETAAASRKDSSAPATRAAANTPETIGQSHRRPSLRRADPRNNSLGRVLQILLNNDPLARGKGHMKDPLV